MDTLIFHRLSSSKRVRVNLSSRNQILQTCHGYLIPKWRRVMENHEQEQLSREPYKSDQINDGFTNRGMIIDRSTQFVCFSDDMDIADRKF